MQELFDIRTATLDGWEKYLIETKNHKTLVLGEFEKPSRSMLERAIEVFVASDAEIEERFAAVINAVQATLNTWDAIVEVGAGPHGLYTSPLVCLPQMAYVEKAVSEPLMCIVHRLWYRARKDGDYTDISVRMLLWSLGADAPLNNDAVARIYREHFKQYAFIAPTILLKRGEVVRASELFDEHASMYGNFDPLSLDELVHEGLQIASAKKWLDQSINAQPKYEEHYQNALDRWQKISDRLAAEKS